MGRGNKTDPHFEKMGIQELLRRRRKPEAREALFFHYLPALESALCKERVRCAPSMGRDEETELFYELRPKLLEIIKSSKAINEIRPRIDQAAEAAVRNFARVKNEEGQIEGAFSRRFTRTGPP